MSFRICLHAHRFASLQACSLALVAALLVPGTHAGAQDRREMFNSIGWTSSGVGKLGEVARLDIPEGCRFTDARGAKKFLELTQNPTSGAEVGALECETPTPGNPADPEMWFVIFEYDKSGYVKDEEKTALDADKILATLREGQEYGNEARRERGWEELNIGGWVRAPYYDEETNNLTWAVAVVASEDTSVNHSVRLLGREGVLKADLVADPGGFERALPTFDAVIGTTEFVPGKTYSEWRDGDKVAKYGLTALVAGGAGAAALKLGLFGKLWKLIAGFAKFIIIGVIALGAWIKNLFTKKESQGAAVPSSPRR